MEDKIGIVTVLYKSSSVLEEFFATLQIQEYKNFVLYAVNNASPDDSVELVNKYSKDCDFETKLIDCKENFGIAKGNNIGIEQALKDGCDYILIANNDIILNEKSISELLKELKNKNEFIAVSKIYMLNGNLWFAGGRFKKLSFRSQHIGFDEKDEGQYDQEKFITYSPTCFMLVKKEVFDNVGLMDERYFVYWDDTDFVYRAQLKEYNILYVPSSTIVHKVSVSTGNGSDFYYRYIFRNRIFFIKKFSKCKAWNYFIDYTYLYTIRLVKMRKNIRQWKIIRDAMKEGHKKEFE